MSAIKRNGPPTKLGKKSGGLAEQQFSVRRQKFEGPLPHPEILRQYEELHPGAADRIFKLTEKETEYRQKIETQALKVNGQSLILSQIFSFIILTIAIGAGAFLIYSGKFLVIGSGIVGTALIPFIVMFLRGFFRDNPKKQDL